MTLAAPAALHTQPAWSHVVKGRGIHGRVYAVFPPDSDLLSFWAQSETIFPSFPSS